MNRSFTACDARRLSEFVPAEAYMTVYHGWLGLITQIEMAAQRKYRSIRVEFLDTDLARDHVQTLAEVTATIGNLDKAGFVVQEERMHNMVVLTVRW